MRRIVRPTGQYWAGMIVGIGLGLMLGAAFVELGMLTLGHKAWASVLGIILVTVGNIVSQSLKRREQTSPPGNGSHLVERPNQ